MEKFKVYSMWTSAKVDTLGLHVHLCTNGFAGSTEKTAEWLNVKIIFAVLMIMPQFSGSRGSALTMLP